MYCTMCGAKIDDDVRFCIYCGASVDESLKTPDVSQKAGQYVQPVPEKVQTGPVPAPATVKTEVKKSAAPVRDGRGKYIVKRLIFFAVAALIWSAAAIALMAAGAHVSASARGADFILDRAGSTFLLLFVPYVFAFLVSMLTGLARGKTAKNVLRIISALLRSLVPFSFSMILLYIFAFRLGLVPFIAMESADSNVIPMISIFLPLCGYLINAAQFEGRKPGLSGACGAIAAWSADKIIPIFLAVLITEPLFSMRGLGTLAVQAAVQLDYAFLAIILLFLSITACVLKLLLDLLSALFAGGDPGARLYVRAEKNDRSGRILLIIGIIVSAAVLLTSFLLPLFSKGGVTMMDPSNIFRTPGENGFILGSDQYGRDFYALLTAGTRNTIIAGLTNTIIAVVTGAIFGVLAGVIRGGASEIFKGVAYVFGHGTGFAIMFLLFTGRANAGMIFAVVGLFAWGGIAERISGAIKARRGKEGRAFIIPVLEQVVHTFCSSLIWTSAVSSIGLTVINPSFPMLGTLLAQGRLYLTNGAYQYLLPPIAMGLVLFAFYLLHAGLCARERS